MKFLIGIAVALVSLAAIGFGVIWSGIYNVAASDAHNDIVAWALDTTMHNSVRSRAEDAAVPASFTEEQARNGFRAFDEMCVLCHGAPGVERTEWAKGMKPVPPPLSEEATHWNSAELFWIVRHGIKMTGMPAIGATHSDEDIWNVVAFVEQLPNMTPEEYSRLRGQLAGSEAGGHGHGGGAGGHGGGAEHRGGHQEDGSEPHGADGGHENAGAHATEGELQDR